MISLETARTTEAGDYTASQQPPEHRVQHITEAALNIIATVGESDIALPQAEKYKT